MASQDFRAETLAELEEGARKIVDALPEERLKEAPDEATRVFLQAMRERWEPVTRATDWDDDQIRTFGFQARETQAILGAGSEIAAEGGKEVPAEIDTQRLPADWAACIGDCYYRVDYCWFACVVRLKRQPGTEWDLDDRLKSALCELYCAQMFELCTIHCFNPLF